MQKRITRQISIGIFSMVVAAFLFGSLYPAAATEKVNLTYWHPYGGKWKVYHEAMVEIWNADRPYIQVKALSVPGEDIRTKLMTAVAGGSPPNAAFVWGSFDSHALPKYFAPLNEFIEKDPLISREDFLPGLLEFNEWKGILYGLPMCGTSTAVFFNKDMFKEAGLDPSLTPKYWDELEAYAEKLTKEKGGKFVQLGFLPFPGSGQASWWVMSYLRQNGGRLWDRESQTVISDESKNLEAMEWIMSWASKYGAEKVAGFFMQAQVAAQAQFADPFVAKQLAMQWNGIWHITETRSYAPDLDFDVFELPYPRNGRPVNPVYIDTMYILKGAKDLEETWGFVKFMNLLTTTVTTGLGGDTPATHDLVQLRLISKDSVLQKVTSYTEHNFEMEEMPVLQFYKDKFTEAVESAWFGTKTTQEALKDLKVVVQREVDRVLGK